MPYRAVAQILKLSNPLSMVKGVLDLFLAQPFGGKSLFQRILMVNLSEETKKMQKDIDDLETKIKEPVLCQKIANAVKSVLPNGENIINQQDPIIETLDLLKSTSFEPVLEAHELLKVSPANEPGKEESHQLVIDLYKLWVIYARKQEQETLMALVFQGVTGELMKDMFAVFYEPLAEVYKAANISDMIGQLSDFIDDLLKIVDHINVQDATNTHQPFINLVQKHEQSFYGFVHRVHAKDQTKLFDNLLGYVDSAFGIISNGLPDRVDLDQCVKNAGITQDEYPLLKQEIDMICNYQREVKQRHLDRTRHKMMANTNDQEGKIVLEGILNDFSDIEDNSSLLNHEMNIQPPVCTLTRKVVHAFVHSIITNNIMNIKK